MNILITSAGRRVSLVKAFQNELKSLHPQGKVFCADNKPGLSAACHVSDGAFSVPRATSDNYINRLIEICKENGIKVIIPTIDTELIQLATAKDQFLKEGIYCVVSDLEIVRICRDKRESMVFFKRNGIDYPKEQDVSDLCFPVFVKPVSGSSSNGIRIYTKESDVDENILNDPGYLKLDYVDPNDYSEFTIDVYFDRNSEVKCIVPRQRIEVRSGEVSKSITQKNLLIDYIFNNFSSVKGFFGCITFQVFLHNNNNSVLVIEINPRFGGGYPLSYAAGANFPKWIIEEYLLDKSISYYNDWEENLLMLRYDKEVLIHGTKC
jgi:carbamoyl-phosphate synthase large subunit